MSIQRQTRGFLISALSTVALAFGASLYPQATVADWQTAGPANENPQNIVIVVSENPRSNAERTCLAVTLAKTLARAKTPDGEFYNPQNVTIFATLDGAALGVERIIDKRRFKCTQGDGSEISLQENLEQFLAYDGSMNHNHLVLCPICYRERFGDRLPDYGVLPGVDVPPTAVIDVLTNADKVIDF